MDSSNDKLYSLAKDLIENSLLNEDFKETYLAIINFLPKEKVIDMIKKLYKAKLLKNKIDELINLNNID
jgi:hypothetical protein